MNLSILPLLLRCLERIALSNNPKKRSVSNDYPLDFKELKKVGILISQARESNLTSIDSLAESLHIDKNRLIALEAAEEKDLPENVFIIGMIRRIADNLKLDADELIKQLNKDSNESQEENIIQEVKSKPKILLWFINLKKKLLKVRSKEELSEADIKKAQTEIKIESARESWEQKNVEENLEIQKEETTKILLDELKGQDILINDYSSEGGEEGIAQSNRFSDLD